MGKQTAIGWCHHTFNLVWGCQRVSPGCQHCYAETLAKRWGHDVWGPAKTTERRVMSATYWKQPITWNDAAAKAGVRERVFCSSMADVFEDHPTNNAERPKLWTVIEQTPCLDWLLLTKRPENIDRMLPDDWLERFVGVPRNVWIGFTAEDQQRFDERWPVVERIGMAWNVPVLFCSAEPLLGPLDISNAASEVDVGDEDRGPVWTRMLDWVICGGESGHSARPMHPDWARSLRDQCIAVEIPFFFKQWGAYAPIGWVHSGSRSTLVRPDGLICRDRSDLAPSRNYEMCKVGAKAAGRLLDGRTWDDVPVNYDWVTVDV
jgi:protein gp37